MSNYPIEHVSFSSFKTYLNSPYLFKRQYIDKNWDYESNDNLKIGKAFHTYVELLHFGYTTETALIEAKKQLFDLEDSKKGNKILDFLSETWTNENPLKDLEVIDVEKEIKSKIHYFSRELPLELKGFIDIVYRDKSGNLCLADVKTVSNYTDINDSNFIYALQACFYYYLAFEEYGEYPTQFDFIQLKKSKNRDGSKQIQNYTINFTESQKLLDGFVIMYLQFLQDIENRKIWLPNISDMWQGNKATEDYFIEML